MPFPPGSASGALSGSLLEESKMKALRYGAWVVLLAIASFVHVQSAKPQEAGHVSDR
jgi:hypothetical protein